MNIFKKITLLAIIMALGSCALKEEDDFYIGPSPKEKIQTPIGTSFTIDKNDVDGDFILNELDKEPYIANYPVLSVQVDQNINFRMNLLHGSSLKEYKMKRFTDVEDDKYIQSKLKKNALNRVVRFFKSNNQDYLRAGLSGSDFLILNPYSEVDSILNLKKLTKEDYKDFEEKSGKISFDGSLKATGNFFKIFNVNYMLGFSDRDFTDLINSKVSRLKTGELDVELSKQANTTKFDVFQTHINPNDLYTKFLKESGSMTMKIDNFDYQLKANGPVYNYKLVKEKILNSTVTVQIITPEEIIIENIYLSRPSSIEEISSILKWNKDEKSIFDDENIKSFKGLKSDLNITNNWGFLKDQEEGRWFIFSSKAINTPKTLFNNGDLVTLAYFQGDEIYRSALKTKRYSFHNFSGSTKWSFLPKLKKNENVIAVIEGVTKDHIEKRTSHSGAIKKIQKQYFLGGNYFLLKEIPFKLKDSEVRFSMNLNDLNIPVDAFSGHDLYENQNSLVLTYSNFGDDKDGTIVINSGNHNRDITGAYHLRVLDSYGNESFSKNSPPSTFLTKYTYNVDIIIESFF